MDKFEKFPGKLVNFENLKNEEFKQILDNFVKKFEKYRKSWIKFWSCEKFL